MIKTVCKNAAILLLLVCGGWAQNGNNPSVNSLTFPVFSLNPAPVSGASISVVGASGQATWYFWASANYQLGSVISPLGVVVNAPNTLTSGNYISIIPDSYPAGVLSVDILATAGPLQPVGACNCAVATGLTSGGVNFQSNSLLSYTVSILNPQAFNLKLTNEVTGTGATSLLLRNAYTGALVCNLSTGCGTSGGGNPGTPLGSIQFDGPSSTFTGIAGVLVATAFSGSDICAQINAAHTALPSTGGTIWIPAGNYAACAGTGTAISITKNSVTLKGAGFMNPLGGITGASTLLNFGAGLVGIDITGQSVTLEDFDLASADTGANSDDAIRNRGNPTTIERVGISHFGRNGVLTLGNSPTNADTWHYTLVQSANNFGDGFQWGGPCTDNHLGKADLLVSSFNAGWGYNVICGVKNEFHAPLAQGNTLGGYHVGAAASYNYFFNTYAESGTGSSFVIDAGENFSRVWFDLFGQPSTITDNGVGDEIHYGGPDNYLVQNGIRIAGQPGSTNNTDYSFSSGTYAARDLGIYDQTDSMWLFNFDPVAKWTFLQKATFTPASSGSGLNVGAMAGDPSSGLQNGDVWYNFTTNAFRCYQNSAITNCIGAASVLIDSQVANYTYTIPSSDAGKLVSFFNNTTAPTAITGPALANNITFSLFNVSLPGTGSLITYTPSANSVNSQANQIVPPFWYAIEFTDNNATTMPVVPTIQAFQNCATAVTFNSTTGAFGCNSVQVTHSGGALTAHQLVIGNAGGDIAVDSVARTDSSGNMALSSLITTSGTGLIQETPGLFSTLPTCNSGAAGTSMVVTDSSSVTWGATATGGGTPGVDVKLFCDGSNWTVEAK